MSGTAARVVLVHDEPAIVDLLGGLFDAHGLVVESHLTLDSVLDRLPRDDFDVIVTEWDLALGLDGNHPARGNGKISRGRH